MNFLKPQGFAAAVGFAAALAMGTTGAPAAPLGQQTTAAGAAFTSSCAGVVGGSGFGTDMGNAIQGGVSTASVNCQASTSAVGGSAASAATASGSTLGHPYTDAASGFAAPGMIKLQSSNTSWPVQFSGGQANGGWNEQLTINKPGMNGQQGVWVIPIHVQGQMNTPDPGAGALFQIDAYLNHNALQGYGNALNGAAWNLFNALNTTHNGNVYSTWDFQMSAWDSTNYGPSDPATHTSMSVDTIVNFVVPITWGTSFELGIYGLVSAGENGIGGGGGQNHADLDFSNTILWGGPGYVLSFDGTSLGGEQITGFDITSLSGTDYSQPFADAAAAPAPATLALFGFGIAGFGWARRRAR
jgi:hypothetical protein